MALGKVKTDMITNSAVTETKLGVGLATGSAISQWHIDSLSINGDTISTVSANNLILYPDSTGKVGVNTSSPEYELTVEGDFGIDNLKMDGNTLSTTNTNGDLTLDPNGTGSVIVDSISMRTNYITTNTSNADLSLRTNGSGSIVVQASILPSANASYDLGSSSKRFANIYTADLSLENNKGSWTIKEGRDDLFIINNKTGKKYKFNLTEV
jgi:hypothetical protein